MSARDEQRIQAGEVGRGASPGRRFVRILPYIGVVVGLLIIVAPAVLDRLDAWRASNEISSLSSTVSALSDEEKAYLLDQAQRYNAVLAGEVAAADEAGDAAGGVASDDEAGDAAGEVAPGDEAGDVAGEVASGAMGESDEAAVAGEELLPYEQQLRTDSASMMAWLDIPGIDLQMPIYHGTGDSELAAGVGHLQSSSLPVGGASTHCALTAHSGMAGSRMFDDIRLLEPGDVFVLWTLGDPLAYEVTGSETVLPEEVGSLAIQRGEDLCTLITCTPYGVNSHRLLVHARRCAYEPEAVAEAPARVTSRVQPLVLACAALGVVVVILVIRRVRKR